jgi:hypothetical protein
MFDRDIKNKGGNDYVERKHKETKKIKKNLTGGTCY